MSCHFVNVMYVELLYSNYPVYEHGLAPSLLPLLALLLDTDTDADADTDPGPGPDMMAADMLRYGVGGMALDIVPVDTVVDHIDPHEIGMVDMDNMDTDAADADVDKKDGRNKWRGEWEVEVEVERDQEGDGRKVESW